MILQVPEGFQDVANVHSVHEEFLRHQGMLNEMYGDKVSTELELWYLYNEPREMVSRVRQAFELEMYSTAGYYLAVLAFYYYIEELI